MPFPETYAEDYKSFQALINNNNLNGLQAAQDSIPRILDSLQRRLVQLRTAEALLLQRIRRDLKLTVATQNSLDANTTSLPLQSYENPNRNVGEPSEDFMHATNKMQRAADGIIYLIQEHNKVSSELKEIQAEIKRYNDLLDQINKKLGSSKIKGAELDQDKIAQSMVVGLMGLFEMSKQYGIYTTKSAEDRGYTENVKIVNVLNKLQTNFQALAEVNPWVLDGTVVLNYTDPGDPANIESLGKAIDNIRGSVAIPDKVAEEVRKYGAEIEKHLNDPVTSKFIKRDPIPTPDPKTAMSVLTNGVDNFWKFSKSVTWWSGLLHKTDKAARTSRFYELVSGLHNKLPICGKTPSQEAQNKDKAQAEAEYNEAEAQKAIAGSIGITLTGSQP